MKTPRYFHFTSLKIISFPLCFLRNTSIMADSVFPLTRPDHEDEAPLPGAFGVL